MDLIASLVGLFALAQCVTSRLAPRTLAYSGFNSTTSSLPATASHSTSDCCFIVQDTLYETWWEIYSVTTYYQPINLTSITTLITPYFNSTVTSYETNVYMTSASSLATQQHGQDPINLFPHIAPGPTEIVTQLASSNGTQIVAGGVTVTSPAAFWAYSTVKVINVPAVTDSNGQLVCATSSVLGYQVTPTSYITTFSGINSNVEAYFGGYDIGLPANAKRNISAPSYSGVTVSFPTPYIYEPSRGASGKTGWYRVDGCWFTGLKEDYGYVPSSVIKYVTDHPDISSQYPGIASCLPGGPSILYVSECYAVAPVENFVATDLTEHTIITVGNGGSSPVPALANRPATTADLAAPGNAPAQQSPVVAFTPVQTPPASTQAPLLQGTAESAVVAVGTVVQPGPQPPAAQTSAISAAIPQGSQPPTAQASLMASATVVSLGSQPPAVQKSGAAVIPIQSSLVITGPTTTPVNPAVPLPGSTTTISGTPFVVIPSPTTIFFPPSANTAIILPSGQTTSISGNPFVIISGIQTIPVNLAFSVSGATTVIGGVITIVSGTPTVVGGTTAVVVSGTETVALPTAQFTGVSPRSHDSKGWLCVSLGIVALVFIL